MKRLRAEANAGVGSQILDDLKCDIIDTARRDHAPFVRAQVGIVNPLLSHHGMGMSRQ